MATRTGSVSDYLMSHPETFTGRTNEQVKEYLQANWQACGLNHLPESMGQIPNCRSKLGLTRGDFSPRQAGEKKAPATGLSSAFFRAVQSATRLGALTDPPAAIIESPLGCKPNPALRELLDFSDARIEIAFDSVPESDFVWFGIETPAMKKAREAREAREQAELNASIACLREKGYAITRSTPDPTDHKVGNMVFNHGDYSAIVAHFDHLMMRYESDSVATAVLCDTIATVAKAERLERERLAREVQAEADRQEANAAAQAGQLAVAAVVADGALEDARILREEAVKELAAKDARIAAMELELERLRSAAIATAIAPAKTARK